MVIALGSIARPKAMSKMLVRNARIPGANVQRMWVRCYTGEETVLDAPAMARGVASILAAGDCVRHVSNAACEA